jgi:tetratricopeptide (TPR) repeat protein
VSISVRGANEKMREPIGAAAGAGAGVLVCALVLAFGGAASPAEEAPTAEVFAPVGLTESPADYTSPQPPAEESPFTLPDEPEAAPAAAAPQAAGGEQLQAGALINQGIESARSGNLQEAEASFREAVRIEPSNPRAWNNLALALRKLNRVDDAISAYHQAIRADQNFALAYKNVGVLLEEMQEYARAAKAYRKYAAFATNAADRAALLERAERLEQSSQTPQ